MVKCKKVLVNVPNLLNLAQQKCHRPDCCEAIVKCTHIISGCSIKLEMTCSASHITEWYSCPQMTSKGGGVIPANNMLEAAGILFSGSHYAKYFMFNRIRNVHGISESTYYRYQKHFLVPVVQQHWKTQQEVVISQLSQQSIILAGDGRCDSSGKCAKYCSYTLMDVDTQMVVHSETVDKREVGGSSPNMEREALFRGLMIVDELISVKEIVTDASTSVKRMLSKLHIYYILMKDMLSFRRQVSQYSTFNGRVA